MNSEPIYVRLLGPVDAVAQGTPCPIAGVRRKSVLAILALCPGEVVASDRLIDLLWEDNPPATATNTLQRHISYLRRVLGKKAAIVAVPKGYILDVSDEAVDVMRATRLIGKGSQTSDHAKKAAQMRAALDLWRGPSLVDVYEVAWLRDQGKRLDELWLDANERLFEARLELGEHSLLVPEIEDLAVRYPFREHVHELLMLALYRTGRQADALAAYQRVRRTLDLELAVDPGLGLRDLEAAILQQDPTLDWRGPAESRERVAHVWVTPAQLPRAIPAFTGRHNELDQLHDQLLPTATRHPAQPLATAISLITGTAGVGKTTLAIQWGHQVKWRFPDGQLYVNLRGFDPRGSSVQPGEAVRGFLDALGVPVRQVPVDLEAQASLYRSVLAGKRVLVVVDNVRDEEQVRPLIPGAPGCAVVVTSRNQLPGLIAAEGANPLTLGLPSEAEARQILSGRLGAQRAAAEPDAVNAIVADCARLPLALSIVAARAALEPTLPLTKLAARLRETTALDSFDGPDPTTNVRAVFSWSYRLLSEPAARLFRLLGLCPGPDIALSAAASVAGLPPSRVRPLLAELNRAHLLIETRPDRFGLHELLRAYAIEQAHLSDTQEQRDEARHRFLDYYLHCADAASEILGQHDALELTAVQPGVTLEQFDGRDEAAGWCDAEYQVALAAVEQAATAGFDKHVWQLARAWRWYLHRHAMWPAQVTVQQLAVQAARRLRQPAPEGFALLRLAATYAHLGRLDDAQAQYAQALPLFEELNDLVRQGHVHQGTANLQIQRGRLDSGLRAARRALELYEVAGHQVGQANALNTMGWGHVESGNFQDAVAHCRQALEVHPDTGTEAHIWDTLGYAYHRLGDYEQSASCYEASLVLSRTVGDRGLEARTLTRLGNSHRDALHPDLAERAWDQARAIHDQLDQTSTGQMRT